MKKENSVLENPDNAADNDYDPMNPEREMTDAKSGVREPMPKDALVNSALPPIVPITTKDVALVPLLSKEDTERFRTTWREVQGKFVDEPRTAVEQADALVSDVVKQLVQLFAHEHTSLDSQWNQGNDVSTEDLRQALLRYHSFFNRLMG